MMFTESYRDSGLVRRRRFIQVHTAEETTILETKGVLGFGHHNPMSLPINFVISFEKLSKKSFIKEKIERKRTVLRLVFLHISGWQLHLNLYAGGLLNTLEAWRVFVDLIQQKERVSILKELLSHISETSSYNFEWEYVNGTLLSKASIKASKSILEQIIITSGIMTQLLIQSDFHNIRVLCNIAKHKSNIHQHPGALKPRSFVSAPISATMINITEALSGESIAFLAPKADGDHFLALVMGCGMYFVSMSKRGGIFFKSPLKMTTSNSDVVDWCLCECEIVGNLVLFLDLIASSTGSLDKLPLEDRMEWLDLFISKLVFVGGFRIRLRGWFPIKPGSFLTKSMELEKHIDYPTDGWLVLITKQISMSETKQTIFKIKDRHTIDLLFIKDPSPGVYFMVNFYVARRLGFDIFSLPQKNLFTSGSIIRLQSWFIKNIILSSEEAAKARSWEISEWLLDPETDSLTHVGQRPGKELPNHYKTVETSIFLTKYPVTLKDLDNPPEENMFFLEKTGKDHEKQRLAISLVRRALVQQVVGFGDNIVSLGSGRGSCILAALDKTSLGRVTLVDNDPNSFVSFLTRRLSSQGTQGTASEFRCLLEDLSDPSSWERLLKQIPQDVTAVLSTLSLQFSSESGISLLGFIRFCTNVTKENGKVAILVPSGEELFKELKKNNGVLQYKNYGSTLYYIKAEFDVAQIKQLRLGLQISVRHSFSSVVLRKEFLVPIKFLIKGFEDLKWRTVWNKNVGVVLAHSFPEHKKRLNQAHLDYINLYHSLVFSKT